MWYKIFIQVFNGNNLGADHIFSYFRDAKASFVIGPWLAVQLLRFCIDKNLFSARLVWVISLILFFLVLKYLRAVNQEETDILVHLWCGQPHTVTGIKR